MVICTVGSHPTQPNSVVGRPGIMSKSCEGALLNQNAVCVRPLNESLDKTWLGYFARSRVMKDYIIAHARGSANQVRVAIGSLKDMDVLLPSIEEQKKVADVLVAYDRLIENNTRRIKILEKMAQTIYREWFVKFRFPGHEKVKMTDSPLGPIPEGWEVTKLGKVANVNELSIKRNNEPEQIEYIDIKSVGTGFVESTTSYSFHEAPGRARRIVRDGDTIWATVRPNRRSYSLILDPVDNLIASTGFAVLTPKNVPFTYLYHCVTTNEFAEYLVNHATGAAYPAVNAKDFSNATVLVPDKRVLGLFNDAVEPMYRQRHIMAKKNKTLRDMRDLLLPRLISGELSLDTVNDREVALG